MIVHLFSDMHKQEYGRQTNMLSFVFGLGFIQGSRHGSDIVPGTINETGLVINLFLLNLLL